MESSKKSSKHQSEEKYDSVSEEETLVSEFEEEEDDITNKENYVKVCVLKLIWRILSAQGSLWVDWVKRYLIRSGSFWAEKQSSTYGSWIWKKILKYRDTAKHFYRVEVNSGDTTSFWFDLWNSLGRLHELLGDRGCIDLGIPIQSTVGEVMSMTRSRRHRQAILNLVEEAVRNQKQNRKQGVRDLALWRGKKDCYKQKFSTKETWSQIRIAKPLMNGYKEIWFPIATPKYAFLTWLVVKNRIATGERMLQWNRNVDPSCILCKFPMEDCDHLFFSCPYSKTVWAKLVKGILVDKFTQNWRDVLTLLASKDLDKVKRFLVGYAFQNTIHSIWGERNNRRHGEQPATTERLVRQIDKNVRNRMSTLTRGANFALAGGLQIWFATRQD